MSEALEFITVDTGKDPKFAVVWLHGLGADCHDFEGLVPQLNMTQAVRFIFPNAPIRPVTINGGMRMRAWYDILEMTLDRKVDFNNIEESAALIEAILADLQAQGIGSERVVLAGFSQGGVIAYQVALHGAYKLAGVMALSTYLADVSAVPSAQESANGQTPFLIHHGSFDPVVSPVLANTAQQCLEEKGYVFTAERYEMPHSVCAEQVKDIESWLKAQFA